MSRTVAIVGRPNVGKSRLFNRLARKRISIVHDQPGVTRDVISTEIEEGAYTLLDTGGLGLTDNETPSALIAASEKQVTFAIDAADLILFVIDGLAGVTALDERIAGALRRSNSQNILLVVNKADFDEEKVEMADAYKLGLKFQGSGIAATGTFLRDHRPVVEQFVKGFLEGVAYAKTHKEESLPLIKEFMKLKDQDEVEDSYQVIIRDVQPRKPYPLKEGVETVLRNVESTIPKAKTVKPEELIDDSVLRRLDQSGFIDALYR